jgi:DNA polymerase-3 subunit epsilon
LRQLILDTETTGLDPKLGHRIIEIACLEMIDRELTGNSLHLFINPERTIDPDASRIHGIYDDDVRDKPIFSELAKEIISFISGAELIIHNAKFDMNFLDFQFNMHGFGLTIDYIENVVDTLMIARQRFPGSKNSLDALCDRFKIDRSDRGLHGALIDCRLLSEVYLNLTREQISLIGLEKENLNHDNYRFEPVKMAGLDLKVVNATGEDIEKHQSILQSIDKSSNGNCIWIKYDQ